MQSRTVIIPVNYHDMLLTGSEHDPHPDRSLLVQLGPDSLQPDCSVCQLGEMSDQ